MADENCEGCPIVNAGAFATAMSMFDQVHNQRITHGAEVAHHERNMVLAEQGLARSQGAAYEIGPLEARSTSHMMTSDEGQSKLLGLGAAIGAAQVYAKTAQTTPPTTGGAPAPGT